mmetsp:Transcript_23356/g.59657  ORF Transcript_23356/g.59657 Transcript_23356/m.59657 type:complete len:212 (+) Transcript_23356:1640-2275(+)
MQLLVHEDDHVAMLQEALLQRLHLERARRSRRRLEALVLHGAAQLRRQQILCEQRAGLIQRLSLRGVDLLVVDAALQAEPAAEEAAVERLPRLQGREVDLGESPALAAQELLGAAREEQLDVDDGRGVDLEAVVLQRPAHDLDARGPVGHHGVPLAIHGVDRDQRPEQAHVDRHAVQGHHAPEAEGGPQRPPESSQEAPRKPPRMLLTRRP